MSEEALTAIEKDYQSLDVVEAAKERMRFIFDNFDEIVINYSGGKDSLAVLILARLIMIERNIQKPLKVSFFDEEFIYPETEDNVKTIFEKPWVEGYWVCVPMDYGLILPDGTERWIKLWDTTRRLVRPLPPKALTSTRVYSTAIGEEIDADFVFNKPEDATKRVCEVIGLRSDESLFRRFIITNSYRSKDLCYIKKSTVGNIIKGVPIYDWSEKDVFKFLKEHRDIAPINSLYYKMLLLRQQLRVGPSIHARRKLELTKIKEENPDHYLALIAAFPSLQTTARYVTSLAQYGGYNQMIKKYGLTLRGMKKLIEDTNTDKDIMLLGMSRLHTFQKAYLDNNKYEKFGHTYESALRVAFISIAKRTFSKPFILRKSKKKYAKTT